MKRIRKRKTEPLVLTEAQKQQAERIRLRAKAELKKIREQARAVAEDQAKAEQQALAEYRAEQEPGIQPGDFSEPFDCDD